MNDIVDWTGTPDHQVFLAARSGNVDEVKRLLEKHQLDKVPPSLSVHDPVVSYPSVRLLSHKLWAEHAWLTLPACTRAERHLCTTLWLSVTSLCTPSWWKTAHASTMTTSYVPAADLRSRVYHSSLTNHAIAGWGNGPPHCRTRWANDHAAISVAAGLQCQQSDEGECTLLAFACAMLTHVGGE